MNVHVCAVYAGTLVVLDHMPISACRDWIDLKSSTFTFFSLAVRDAHCSLIMFHINC